MTVHFMGNFWFCFSLKSCSHCPAKFNSKSSNTLALKPFFTCWDFFKYHFSIKLRQYMQEFNAFCLWKRLLRYEDPHSIVHAVTDSFSSLAWPLDGLHCTSSVLNEVYLRLQYMAEKLLQIFEDGSSTTVLNFTLLSVMPRNQVWKHGSFGICRTGQELLGHCINSSSLVQCYFLRMTRKESLGE